MRWLENYTKTISFSGKRKRQRSPRIGSLRFDGIALVHRGKNEEAIKVLNKADSNNLPARAMLSYSLFHTGRWEEWSRVVSELKDAQPRQEYEEFDQLFLGYAYFYVNHEVSAELLRKVLEQHPTWIVPRRAFSLAPCHIQR